MDACSEQPRCTAGDNSDLDAPSDSAAKKVVAGTRALEKGGLVMLDEDVDASAVVDSKAT